MLVVAALVAVGLWWWWQEQPRTERHLAPITAVRIADGGNRLEVDAALDHCFPGPAALRAEPDGDVVHLSVVQSREVVPGEPRFCDASCPSGATTLTMRLPADWAGRRLRAAPDDGHCSLGLPGAGVRRAGALGTVPAPDP